jgi:hypothetical protein
MLQIIKNAGEHLSWIYSERWNVDTDREPGRSDDPLRHPEIQRMTPRELADLPMGYRHPER